MTPLTGRIAPVLAVLAALLLGWLLVMPHVGTNSAEPQPPPPPPAKPPREQFAADRAGPAAFDSARALRYLDDLCKLGPRLSGSEGMKKQQELIEKHFTGLGAKVEFQRFTGEQRNQKPVAMANIIISWHPDRTRRAMICSHYDTRPVADQEPERRMWNRPFASANDGTSGVAWMMELGHHLKDLQTAVGVDFVLFDGEEYVFDGHQGRYFFGSDHFAEEYQKHKPAHRYAGAVLLDLFAGKDPHFPIEQNSWFLAGGLVQEVWKIAAEQGVTAFQNRVGPQVQDDHLALNRAGIPAVDVIDFDYPHWHKLGDTPEQVSGASMEQVARVLTAWLQRAR